MHLMLIPFASSFTEYLSTAGYAALGILGLGIVIFVHELGHFLAAKICGVKCEKFYVGFDPPLKYLPSTLFKKKFGETEYGIGIVPLGGYVKMLGQNDNPADSAKEAERIRIARLGETVDGEPQYDIDPRSYPAKTVGQRLFIISAGVIMNLIFAVIFGMCAYRMGVSYTPCVIGHTSPGLSAWQVGLQQGDQILQVGRDGKKSEHLRFSKDMVFDVMKAGVGNEVDLLVRRYNQTELEWVPVLLSAATDEEEDRPFIGIGPIAAPRNEIYALLKDTFEEIPTNHAYPPLKLGDRVIGINGKSVHNHIELSEVLATTVDEEITLTVERSDPKTENTTPERLDITIPPNRMRWLGIGMKMGRISAVQKDSPAAKSGFKKDDVLKSINGTPLENSLIVPHQLRRMSGETVSFVVTRNVDGKSEDVSLSAKLRVPTMRHTKPGGIVSYVAAEALGIAFEVTNVVASVVKGSPAEMEGLAPGDTVTKVEFIAASREQRKQEGFLNKPIDLEKSSIDWPLAQFRMQFSLPDTKIKLTYLRDGETKTLETHSIHSDEWYVEDRGLMFAPEERIHQASTMNEAFSLGLSETYDGLFQVVFMLKKLFSGEASTKYLGGPLTIVYVAGAEAKSGVASLLTFLTMLSANLAVLNFLPIPVLDGGHVVFLVYEGVFRKPLDERIAFVLNVAGFCFILSLVIFVFGLDIWRFAEMFS